MNKSLIKNKGYELLIKDVGILLEEVRKKVYTEVNSVLVKTYWEIGRHIVKFEQKGREKAEYGSALLDKLAEDLIVKYGKGFSRDYLEKMRKFYVLFSNSETLLRNLSWSHYCILLRVNDILARNFYSVEADKEKWSVRELDSQVNSSLFERLALSKDAQGVLSLTKKGQIIEKPQDLIKNPYVLDFLGLSEFEQFTEKELEENLTIGIFLCADKKEAIVKYTLPVDVKNIFAAKYKLYLPDKKETGREVKENVK